MREGRTALTQAIAGLALGTVGCGGSSESSTAGAVVEVARELPPALRTYWAGERVAERDRWVEAWERLVVLGEPTAERG